MPPEAIAEQGCHTAPRRFVSGFQPARRVLVRQSHCCSDPAVPASLQPESIAALVGTGGLLLGWLFATLLRRQDDRTFVLGRAPALPIRSLAAHDDAWLRGRVRAEHPLVCPWFRTECVAFAYRIEREVTRTRVVTRNGKTHTETTTSWETEHSEQQATDFDLDDGAVVRVALTEGDNEAMESAGVDYETRKRRHSASVLPVGAEVSVLGVLRDDRTFGPLGGVPLLVTRQTREQRVRSAARRETWLFGLALCAPFVGFAVAAGMWQRAATWPQWLLAAASGAAAVVPLWWLLTYNRLVRLRSQVRTAQRQIAIDLGVREDLVPNLVAVVRSTAAHERELLTHLMELRTRGDDLDARVQREGEACAATREVLLLHEKYPELRTDAVYRDLHERLWAVEEKIAHSRGFYNDVVTEWNDRVATFPSLLVARLCRWREAALFQVATDERLPARLQ